MVNKMKQIIYGPPGTGKSTYITKKAKDYLEKNKNANIALCSYTKASASVLKNKIGEKVKLVGTIHSLAFKIIGATKEMMVDPIKLANFQTKSGIEFGRGALDALYDDNLTTEGDEYLAIYNVSRGRLNLDHSLQFQKYNTMGSEYNFKYCIDAYETWKKSHGYIDFTDILIRALNCPPLAADAIFIDEAQDLSPLQWRLIDYWSANIDTIYICGDDDQAIYKWAGADPEGMIKFQEKHSCDVHVLEQSYRLPRVIHEKSQELIQSVSKRVNKKFLPREAEGDINYMFDIQNCEIDENVETLILYRNHSFRRDIEQFLYMKAIPYLTRNGKKGPLQEKTWKTIELFLQIKKRYPTNKLITEKEMRVLKSGLHYFISGTLNSQSGRDGLFKMNWEDILPIGLENLMYYISLLSKYDIDEIKPKLTLSSIHGSKGLEADNVILINGMSERTFSNFMSGDHCDEYRVFYVGITRAKKRLDIVTHDNALDSLN